MKKLLIAIVLFLFVQKSFSQSTDYTYALRLINSWIEAQRDYSDIPSLSVAIVKDRQTIWSWAYGMANKDSKVAATTNTVYSICSISKLFTSAEEIKFEKDNSGKVTRVLQHSNYSTRIILGKK